MSSGIRCGSPAQHGRSRCYYHHSVKTLLPKRFVAGESFRNEWDHGIRMFPMPLLEDATSIQTALMQVIHTMLEGAIDVQRARVVLSALRAAQRNLPAFKVEMASADTERESPSDTVLTAEMKWNNRVDDVQPGSDLVTTVSPANRNGDLGQATPKVPAPTAEELEAAALEQALKDAAAKEIAAAKRSRGQPAAVMVSAIPSAQSKTPVPLPPKKTPEVAASQAPLRRSKRRS